MRINFEHEETASGTLLRKTRDTVVAIEGNATPAATSDIVDL